MSYTAPTAAAAAPAAPMKSTAPTAVTSTTTAPTTVSNTTTAQPGSGSRLGEKLRGAFDVVHGAGEILRGGALSAADDIGDSVARRQSTSEKSDAIAQKGADEYAGGLGKWKEPKY